MDLKKIYEWLELSGAKFGDTSKEDLALQLIKEEFDELHQANLENDREGMLDAFADINWVLLNLFYFKGFNISELEDMYRKVTLSNFSKFCTSEKEVTDTQIAYMNGTHWDKLGTKINCISEKVNDYWVIKRADNGKILKSINYKPVNKL